MREWWMAWRAKAPLRRAFRVGFESRGSDQCFFDDPCQRTAWAEGRTERAWSNVW